jgi:hypothetical protein
MDPGWRGKSKLIEVNLTEGENRGWPDPGKSDPTLTLHDVVTASHDVVTASHDVVTAVLHDYVIAHRVLFQSCHRSFA